MSNGMTNVRSTDTNTHKQTAVLAILLADTIGDKLDPPLPEDRGLLGYINMRTAELLCPVDCLADLRSNPERCAFVWLSGFGYLNVFDLASVAKALQSGQSKKYLSKGDKLLWSLYDETLCVLGKMFEGAFRSRFVIRVCPLSFIVFMYLLIVFLVGALRPIGRRRSSKRHRIRQARRKGEQH